MFRGSTLSPKESDRRRFLEEGSSVEQRANQRPVQPDEDGDERTSAEDEALAKEEAMEESGEENAG
jgi:hypothetical protein